METFESDRILAIVVPCFNEHQVLPTTVKELLKILRKLTKEGKINSLSKLLFVNDGSSDETESLIEKYSK